jgi:hypothetical protein
MSACVYATRMLLGCMHISAGMAIRDVAPQRISLDIFAFICLTLGLNHRHQFRFVASSQ